MYPGYTGPSVPTNYGFTTGPSGPQTAQAAYSQAGYSPNTSPTYGQLTLANPGRSDYSHPGHYPVAQLQTTYEEPLISQMPKLGDSQYANREKATSVPAQDKLIMSAVTSTMASVASFTSGLQAVTIANQILSKVVDQCDSFKKPDKTQSPFGLTNSDISTLCGAVIRKYKKDLKSLVKVQTPVKVFGDIHGNIMDLVAFFSTFGKPTESPGDIRYMNYIFNGDFVDRGDHSLEVILTLLSLKLVQWNRVTLIRGNHECEAVNTVYGFFKECKVRLGEPFADIHALFNEVFSHFPLAATIQIPVEEPNRNTFKYVDHVLVMHGGIGSCLRTLKDLEGIHMPLGDEESSPLAMQLMWNDPSLEQGNEFQSNPTRGDSTEIFTSAAIKRFCRNNNIHKIIRSHQCVENGFENFADGQLITVFSARNYANRYKNSAAILVVTHAHKEQQVHIDVCILEYNPNPNPNPHPQSRQGLYHAPHGAGYEAQFMQKAEEDKFDSSPVSILKRRKMKPHNQVQYTFLELATQKCYQEKMFDEKKEAPLKAIYNQLAPDSKFDISMLSVFIAHYLMSLTYLPLGWSIMKAFDLTGENNFDWETFKRFVFFTTQPFEFNTPGYQIHLLYVFRCFDNDDDGVLNYQELNQLVLYHNHLGNGLDGHRITQLMQHQGSTTLNFQQFYYLIQNRDIIISYPFLKFLDIPG